MPRLRRTDCAGPGISRRRRGRGFKYRWLDGTPVTDRETLDRIIGLVIPPAWRDVWICPWSNGLIQATGTDVAGRRQYRYHDAWRTKRDAEKHERVLDFAALLPGVRERVAADLAVSGLPREKVLATAVRLLDLGFFRVGSEEYAEENNTYGLATMRKDHVTVEGNVVLFDYESKGGKQRVQSVVDPEVRDVVVMLKRRRGGSYELLAYRDGQHWRDIKSDEINAYLRELAGTDCTAKDFRTWHATVLMAVALAVSTPAAKSESARKRAVARAVREVADYLGNTPAVCRKSYIDPRVIDLYNDGITVAPALEQLGATAAYGELATRGAVEAAVLQLLKEPAAARKARARRRRAAA